jgi:hypothetical protein
MENKEKYKKEKMTINVYWANIVGVLIFIPTILIFGLPFYFMWKSEFQLENFLPSVWSALIVVLALILGIIAHELIHGIMWARFAKNGFKSIKFGIMWKMITPYCHCKEPLKVSHYVIGAIMPAILLGFIPAILAVIIGNSGLLFLGIFFTVAACGDFLVKYSLRKESKDTLVEDHPSEVGFYVYRLVEEV